MADTYRLLLDENIEHEVLDRLVDAGHDVEHVDTVANLGKGASDTELAGYSVATDRAIVTYDDDFIADVPPTDYRAVLFFENDTLTAREVASTIHAMAELYPYREVEGLQKTGRQWL
jgi:predicted nuclease of predicted toxin-antitoxin system